MPNRSVLRRATLPVVAFLLTPAFVRADGFFFTEYYQKHTIGLEAQQISASSPTPTLSVSPIRTSATSTGDVLGSGTRTIVVTANPHRSDNFWEETLGDFEAAYRRFELYPTYLGQIGTINYSYNLAGSPTTENGTPGGGSLSINIDFPRLSASSGWDGSASGSGSLPIFAGNFVQLRVAANANTASSGASGTASVTYNFDLIEDRVHFGTQSFDLTADDPAAWFEHAAPGAQQIAVFTTNLNSGTTRLTSDTTWRGLVTDGFRGASINLDGHTLHLVKNDSSTLARSITIGEERGGHTGLTLNSGHVVADQPVIVENRTAAQANSQGFPGSAALNIANGATLDVSSIVTSVNPGTNSGLSVANPGSRISADQITIGKQGNSSSIVLDGGKMETTQLLEIARGDAGSTAELSVSNPGSSLVASGFAFVGGAAKGILAITGGATANFNATKVTVGNATDNSSSRLTITGTGTTSTGGIFAFGRGAVLEVTNHASFTTSGASGIGLSTEGSAKFTDGATVTAGNLLTLDRDAEFRILSGATVNVENVHIEPNNRLITGGASTRLNISNDFLVNGEVAILTGSTVIANTLAVGGPGRIYADANATLKVFSLIMVNGSIVPDATAFLTEEPPPPPGGGGEALVAASSFADSAESSPVGAHFTIDGNVLISPTGSIDLDILGPGLDQADHVSILGDLEFQGKLNLNFKGYAPTTGQFLSLIDSRSITGLTPDDIYITGIDAGWQFDLQFNPSTGSLGILSLTNATVPEPSLLIVAPIALLFRRRR